MKKIIVLISGSGSNLEAIAKACQNGSIAGSIELVISNQPNVKGLERAQKFHLMSNVINHKEFDSRESFDKALLEQILPVEPDLIVLAGFMRILGKDFTQAFEGKLINIHPSLLPEYPGLNTHQQAINNGDLMHGISIHYVNSNLDDGPHNCSRGIKD
jgi:phosphoribosylglycinamide formyltransferase-1